MKFRSNPWLLVCVVLVTFAATLLLWRWRMNEARVTVADAAAHMPVNHSLLFHLDFDKLRQVGLHELLVSNPVTEEADYRRFVSETGFDWKTDLESVTASRVNDDWYLIANGRFDWERLRVYAVNQRGGCHNGTCNAPSATPGRNVSFFPQSNRVLAMATSKAEGAVYALRKPVVAPASLMIPDSPVWVSFAGNLLSGDPQLPPGGRLFAKVLSETKRTTVWLQTDATALEIRMAAECPNPESAAQVQAQLAGVTAEFRKYFERIGQQPNAGDLSGILLEGKFEQQGATVQGRWPIRLEFLKSLVGGAP